MSIFQTLHAISDTAIEWLLKFIGVLLHFFAQRTQQLKEAARLFPNSLYLRDKFIRGSSGLEVRQYVVCPSCHSLCSYTDCLEKRGSKLVSKHCCNVIHSTPCNANLLKGVVSIV